LDELLNPFLYGRVFKEGLKFKDKISIAEKLGKIFSGSSVLNLISYHELLFRNKPAEVTKAINQIKSALKKNPQDPNLRALDAHARLCTLKVKDKSFEDAYSLLCDAAKVLYSDSLSLYHFGLFIQAYTRYFKLWHKENTIRRELPREMANTEGIKKIIQELDSHSKGEDLENLNDMLKHRTHQFFL